MNIITRILAALSTRKCHGCDSTDPHTAHLTRLGKKRYA